MARNGNGTYRQGGYGGLIVALILVVAALGGGAYWLWSQQDAALRELRLDADSRALEAVVPFPEHVADAGTAGGQDEPQTLAQAPDGDAAPAAGAPTGAADPTETGSNGVATGAAEAQSAGAPPQPPADGANGGGESAGSQSAGAQSASEETGSDDRLPPPARPEPPGESTAGDQAAATEQAIAGNGETSQQVSIAELINRPGQSGTEAEATDGDDSSADTGAEDDGSGEGASASGEPAEQAEDDMAGEPAADPLSSQLAQLSGQRSGNGDIASVMPPRELNAEPFLASADRPRIALIVRGLGGDDDTARQVVADLPEPITLAFQPGAAALDSGIARARLDGHEVLVAMPLAAGSTDAEMALSADLSSQENIRRLTEIMDLADRAVGLIATLPPAMDVDATLIGPVLTELALAGYLFVEGDIRAESPVAGLATRIGLPVARADVQIGAGARPDAMADALRQLEAIAERRGQAVGVADWSPGLIGAIEVWAAQLDTRGVALAPITALADAP